MSAPRYAVAGALLALLCCAAGLMVWLAVVQLDDVYIVYRYARNLANGTGFVFNPGERVEGVSCFLWTVMLAPFAALGVPLPRIAPVLGAACGLGSIVLVARMQAEYQGRQRLMWRDLLPALLLASSPYFLYWSVGALEAVPFTLLVTLALRDHMREMRERTRFPRSALWLTLAAMTRPEAPVLIVLLGAARLFEAHTQHWPAADRRAGARWLMVLLGILGPFFAWRYFYFGEWLPNTYYAKLGAPLHERASVGLTYVGRWAASLLPHFGMAGWALRSLGLQIMILLTLLLGLALRDTQLRAAALIALGLVLAGIYEGGDWMPMYRFMVPVLPALALVSAAALLNFAARGRAGQYLGIALVVVLLLAAGDTAYRERNGDRGLLRVNRGYQHAHQEVGAYIAAHGFAGETVAVMDIGMIGWLAARQRIVDISGLTDRVIAHATGGFLNKRYAASYIFDQRPRYMVLVPSYGPDERLAADPRMREHYVFKLSRNAHRYMRPPGSYSLMLFERSAP